MSQPASALRWPDLLIVLFCVLLVCGLALLALRGRGGATADSTVYGYQLRSIHQAMLLYGLDNGGFLPGLDADGSLFNNDPAYRFGLLSKGAYLPADTLRRADESDQDLKYSFAILDIESPGARRDAWRTELQPRAVVLSDRQERFDTFGGGWVMWHDLSAEQFFDTPRLTTRYTLDGPSYPDDDLFSSEDTDDAYLISPGSRP